MNYITEINQFYDWLETNPVPDSSIVLWHALMHINNKCGWKKEFAVAISSIQNKTGLSKSSILRARNNLQQSGRISFISRNGQQAAIYTLIAFQGGAQSGTQSGTQSGAQTGTQTVPILKLNETKLKSKSHSGHKSGTEKKTIDYWKKFVEAWFEFYKSKFTDKPTFNATMAASLKSIMLRIRKTADEKKLSEWTEEYAVRCLIYFLNKAYADDWLKANFLLTNLSSKFDSIVNQPNDGTTSKNNRGIPSKDAETRNREYAGGL